MLRIRVSTASAEITETELITAGRVGLQCAFEFNSAWDGLAKTVIVNGVVKRDIVLVSDTIVVPGECLAREQFPLRIGVYGANGAGEIVIPTIWANFGKILPSARPSGVDPDEVTPDVVAQIQANSSNALMLAQEVLRRADSGEFDGRDGATGQQGPVGPTGNPGEDGISPVVTVTAITGGHRVTITDAQGTHTFDVMDGESGGGDTIQSVDHRTADYRNELVITRNNATERFPFGVAFFNFEWSIATNSWTSPIPSANVINDIVSQKVPIVACLILRSSARIEAVLPLHFNYNPGHLMFWYEEENSGWKIEWTESTAADSWDWEYSRYTPVWNDDIGYLADNKLDIDQGTANAGKFLVVGSDGNITAVTMTAWQGGSY